MLTFHARRDTGILFVVRGYNIFPRKLNSKLIVWHSKTGPEFEWFPSSKISLPFPLKTSQVLAKPKQKVQMLFMACFPLHQKAVKAKLFFCSFLTQEMPQHQNCEQRGSERRSETAACPVQSWHNGNATTLLDFDQARKRFTYNWLFLFKLSQAYC